MNGPHPRGSIKPKSGWALMKRRAEYPTRKKRLQEMYLVVTNMVGDAASHKMTEDDCIELGLALLQHVRDLRFARKAR